MKYSLHASNELGDAHVALSLPNEVVDALRRQPPAGGVAEMCRRQHHPRALHALELEGRAPAVHQHQVSLVAPVHAVGPAVAHPLLGDAATVAHGEGGEAVAVVAAHATVGPGVGAAHLEIERKS